MSELVEEPGSGEREGESGGQADAEERGAFLGTGGEPVEPEHRQRQDAGDAFGEDGARPPAPENPQSAARDSSHGSQKSA